MRLGVALGPPRRTAAAIEFAVRAGAPAEPLRAAVRPGLVERDGHTVILARPGDLLTLCGHDALDVALLGTEVLLERGPEVVELVDLEIGRARLVAAAPRPRGEAAPGAAPGACVAGGAAVDGGGTREAGSRGAAATAADLPAADLRPDRPTADGPRPDELGADELPRRPRVATAHPWLTRRYLEARGYQPRLIALADEPWPCGQLLRLDLVVGLLDEGDEPEPPFVLRGEVAAGGLRLVAGMAAHALRGGELAGFARRAREVAIS